MLTNHDHTEIIERYLNAELTPDEQTWFENEMKTNPAFAGEVLLNRNINSAILQQDVISLRKKVSEIGQEYDNKSIFIKEFFHFKWKYIAVAASITLLFAFGLKFLTNSSYTNDELYNLYYESYEGDGIVRSGENTDPQIAQALSLYENKQYDKALQSFDKILENDFSLLSIHLYKGIANMETFNFKKAIESFQLIIDHQNNLYVEQAEWYMGICYLKMYQTEKAVSILSRIAEEDSTYGEKATELLNKL